jgi:AraC-like DNA-binding protein
LPHVTSFHRGKTPKGTALNVPSPETSTSLERDYRVDEVLKMISTRFREPLTLDHMSEHVNLSKSHLTTLFRRCGLTAHCALVTVRMERAAELLRTTHLRIKEIAEQVGIEDQSHFVRGFERYHGLSPDSFRREHYLKILKN